VGREKNPGVKALGGWQGRPDQDGCIGRICSAAFHLGAASARVEGPDASQERHGLRVSFLKGRRPRSPLPCRVRRRPSPAGREEPATDQRSDGGVSHSSGLPLLHAGLARRTVIEMFHQLRLAHLLGVNWVARRILLILLALFIVLLLSLSLLLQDLSPIGISDPARTIASSR